MGEMVQRVCKVPLICNKHHRVMPVNTRIWIDANRAKFLRGQGKIYEPGEEPEDVVVHEPSDLGIEAPAEEVTTKRKARKPLKVLQTDAAAEAEAEAAKS